MTEEERLRLAEAMRAAWREGFTASRHWPNHPMPILHITWKDDKATIEADWKQRVPGYLG